ncbi:arginyltransferase [Methylococcus sp. EFPC2]|uniref:arginyltransferase n=1 Tax=Methylococcus sp. EFPC2 TaxID=2812648 RepID=UPI001968843B|nr:arginyltransferase [Methylococcus sp. EFPC2]QSA98968.1 arginyltransferase [Methylococcus sp. EFPC2]
MRRISLYLDRPHDCSYLAGREARLAYVDPTLSMTTEIYGELAPLGFRRSGNLVYRPQCPGCSACVPVRIPLSRFRPNRSQHRIERLNRDVIVTMRPAAYTDESYELFRRYLGARHSDGGMADSGAGEFIGFLASDWSDTVFIEFRLEKRLFAVAVVDRFKDAWSAVYTFFDPDYAARSPGVLAVLWQITEARHLGLDWLYLGYWIGACRKMAYKTQYRPLEAYVGGQWRLFEKGENIEY